MPVKVQTPSKSQIDELRNRFLQKYEKNPPPVPFHSVDLHRVKNEDIWCTRFLEMYDLDMDVCLEKLWETCVWRQSFGANDLDENTVRKDYLMDGVVFTHNRDLDGKPLLIFRTKYHTKGSKDMDEVIRVVVYWIERIHRETNMAQMTLFFDMDGTGLSNMDLDFVKKIIETFKLYYPNALNYILVFELAWVLNAAFKIIKGLLPAKAQEILKVITKKDVEKYVDKSNCLKSWGGTDDYTFNFIPEKPRMEIQSSTDPIPAAKENGSLVSEDRQNNNHSHDKKVHFANSSPVRWPQTTEVEKFHTPHDHNMLQITPNEFLVFSQGENSDTLIDITSTSKVPVMYKIQTTSPEKFRVRPRCGVLLPNHSVGVNILLKAEHHLAESAKDKFLVMCTPAPLDMDLSSPQQIAEIWKQKPTNSGDVEQHRLCCVYKNDEHLRNGQCGQHSNDLSNAKSTSNITELAKHAKHLERELKHTHYLQYATLVLMIIVFVAVGYLLRLEMDSGALNSSSSAETLKSKSQ